MRSSAPVSKPNAERRNYWFIISFTIAFLALAPVLTRFVAEAGSSSMRVEKFSVRPDAQVRIDNPRGSTRVEVWNEQAVRVVAEKTTGTINASELVLMSAQNTVYVECKQVGQPGIINLQVFVPRRSHLQVTGGSGTVEVDGPLAGAVVQTSSGRIDYRIPESADAQIVMHSARGTVRSGVAMTVSERTGARSLQGRLGGGRAPVILNSQSGNITLSRSNRSALLASMGEPAETAAGIDAAGSNRATATQPGQGRDHQQPIFKRGDAQPTDESLQTGDGEYDDPFGDKAARQRSSSTGQRRPATPPATPSGGYVDFGGGTRNSDSSTTYSSGPLTRPREEKIESADNMGMRVRIIPADQPLGTSRSTADSIFDQTDDAAARPDQPASGGRRGNTRSTNQSSHDPFGNRPSTPLPDLDDEPEPASGSAPRRGNAPVLRRSNVPEPTGAGAAPDPDAAAGEPNEEMLTLNSSLINLNVSVTNRSGAALQSLKKEDFEISENGSRQELEFFKSSNEPFNLVLVLDLSGSIQDKLDVVKSAALRFMDVIGPQDKVAVLVFTDEIKVISSLSSDREMVRKRIKAIEKTAGATKFYEAMWFALADTLRGTKGQRNAIVVMTDGVDSSLDRYDPLPSRVSFERLARRLEESDVLVFPVYLDTEFDEVFRGRSSSEAYAVARQQLETVAELTGGQMFKAEQASDLSGVYKQVAGALRTVYSLGYYSTKPERDGTFRRVRVVVNKPDAAVKTRKGYYAK